MASRQEEKERRRREREAAEAAERRAAARRKRVGIVGGAVLSVAIVAAVVVAIAAGGGDGGGDTDGGPRAGANTNVQVPSAGIENLQEAVDRAGCTLRTVPSEGRDHIQPGTQVDYDTNPPTSGPHLPTPADDGIYDPGNEPDMRAVVHSLEHGRVVFQYRPGTPQQRVQQLEALFNQEVNGVPGYHSLLLRNTTDMDAAVAVTAWTQLLTCPDFQPATFDALSAFRERYVDKGPEFVP